MTLDSFCSMTIRCLLGFAAFTWSAGAGRGQLYVMTGAPTSNGDISDYAFNLFALDKRKLQPAAHIADGASWIGVAWDQRKMVILGNNPEGIKVVDFDKAAITKECPDPPAPVGGFMSGWLLDSPSKGLVFTDGDPDHPALRGMVLDSSVSCAASFTSIDPAEARFYSGSGVAGLWTIGGAESIRADLEPDGRLTLSLVTGVVADLARIPKEILPKAAFSGPGRRFANVTANNRQALIFTLIEGAYGPIEQVFFRKHDQKWGVIHVPPDSPQRTFGTFATFVESFPRNKQHPASAGSGEWRKAFSKSGPNIQYHFEEGARSVYTGKLHIFDIETEKLYTINTNQADSEILLIEDVDVYYRVSDRLYKASLRGEGISPGQLLVRDEEIRDVHWAFIKH